MLISRFYKITCISCFLELGVDKESFCKNGKQCFGPQIRNLLRKVGPVTSNFINDVRFTTKSQIDNQELYFVICNCIL
jgi:hypothetical protein